MKKIILSTIVVMSLLNANNITKEETNKTITTSQIQNSNISDPFEQMEKIFQMQLKQMEQMQKQMDNMFKVFESQNMKISLPSITASGGIISSGIVDKGNYYEIILNTNKDSKLNIKVEAKNGILTIKVDEQKELNKKTSFGVVKSFSTSSYMQSFTLPKDADEKNIKYETKDNKIIVHIPKKK